MNKCLKVKHLLLDNSVEKGSGSGVARDSFSSFWVEFYDCVRLEPLWKCPFSGTISVQLHGKKLDKFFWKDIKITNT